MSLHRSLALLTIIGCSSRSPEPITPEPIRFAPPPLVAVRRDGAAPWTLTASDGSGLQLVRVDAKAVVEGPLALTELHLYFHNPEARTREGRFEIVLPTGAAVSRFAMERDGGWQEAEVVDKALARRAYEDFLHRRQDPALLEMAAGNQFSARVFPIPAKADKHLVISYSQELPNRYYSLPLRGLPTTERVDVRLDLASADGTYRVDELHKRDWRPDRDFSSYSGGFDGVASRDLVAATLDLGPTVTTADPPEAVTLLVDTSASRALGFATYVRAVRDLVRDLRDTYGGALELQVIAFDQETRSMFSGPAGNFGSTEEDALLERGAAGASDLSQAIEWLARSKPHRRVVVVTDGVMTAGLATPELVAAVGRLEIERLDVALAGGIRDERLASALVRSLPHAGDVFDLDGDLRAAVIGLGESVQRDVAIDVPGATWVYPRVVPAVRRGSTPTIVYARMASPTRTIEIVAGGERHTRTLTPATRALLERAVARANVEELERRLEATPATSTAERTSLREDIAKRSIAARVVSSQTAMLVLESEADFARYKIDRKATSDILVVGPGGISHVSRTITASREPRELPPAPTTARDVAEEPADGRMALEEGHMGRRDSDLTRQQAIEMARSAGILGTSARVSGGMADLTSGFDDAGVYGPLTGDPWGTIGNGRYGTIGSGTTSGGYGAGGGRGGMRGRTPGLPSLAIGIPVAAGNLDKAIIRRYIKRNIQKLQYCYERTLLAKPSLRGTIIATFTISADGTVAQSTASGVDPDVATCMASVIATINFPRPNTGTVQVSYPFTVQPPDPSAPRLPPPPALTNLTAQDYPHPSAPEPLTRPTDQLAAVMTELAAKHTDRALVLAKEWRADAPGDVLAIIAVGEALEARGDREAAARMYGSIIDLYPNRADYRRFAGERLQRIGTSKLVIDTYRRAVADRPDHVTGHRLLAYALLRDRDYAGAFAAILAGLDQPYPSGRFLGADRVLGEDAGIIAAAYLAHGGKRADISPELAKRNLQLASGPSTRFIAYWETDANDVDLHVRDARGNHAWYQSKQLASGGELYADITTGYGPECFAIHGKPSAGPYHLSLHYYAQGPMGYGMGLLEIQRYDGNGNLTFEDRPYLIMNNDATVELGAAR